METLHQATPARNAAQAALELAEQEHAEKRAELQDAINHAEALAGPRVKDAKEAIEKAMARVNAANAALAEADAAHRNASPVGYPSRRRTPRRC